MATDGNSNPLERTTDMEGLSAADRARIYKERAAAAGIGRPPSAEPAAGATGDGTPATRPSAPPPAEPAAVATRPASATPGGGLSPEQRERLAAVVQRSTSQTAATATSAGEQQPKLVYVWPHLLTIELIAAVLMLLSMVLISVVLQAPLEGHANADKTPNPSKAPWYFLNLQELLLHMHPALAGVIVPTAALALIAIIPYFDRDTRDVGKWFGTPRAVQIVWFTTWYSFVVLTTLVVFDELVGVKPLMKGLAGTTGIAVLNSQPMVDIVVPLLFMFAPIVLLIFIIQKRYKPEGVRDWMICFFTGFVAVYVVLTVYGTFFRGQGMHLYWPWDPRQIRIE